MKKTALLIMLLALGALAQGTHPEYYQPRRIVFRPNAGLLPDRSWMGELHLGEGGSTVGGFSIGLWGRLQAGVSYGAYNVLGRGEAIAYPRPSFIAKVRPLHETQKAPAIVLGFEDQGLGRWDGGRDRYSLKSPGFFLVASKNWASFGGNFGLHAGINYSLETEDEGRGFDAYIGLDKNLGGMFAVSVEYIGGINDYKKDGAYGLGRGYLNIAGKWSVRPDFEIEFIAADCLLNSETESTFSREVRLSFIYPL